MQNSFRDIFDPQQDQNKPAHQINFLDKLERMRQNQMQGSAQPRYQQPSSDPFGYQQQQQQQPPPHQQQQQNQMVDSQPSSSGSKFYLWMQPLPGKNNSQRPGTSTTQSPRAQSQSQDVPMRRHTRSRSHEYSVGAKAFKPTYSPPKNGGLSLNSNSSSSSSSGGLFSGDQNVWGTNQGFGSTSPPRHSPPKNPQSLFSYGPGQLSPPKIFHQPPPNTYQPQPQSSGFPQHMGQQSQQGGFTQQPPTNCYSQSLGQQSPKRRPQPLQPSPPKRGLPRAYSDSNLASLHSHASAFQPTYPSGEPKTPHRPRKYHVPSSPSSNQGRVLFTSMSGDRSQSTPVSPQSPPKSPPKFPYRQKKSRSAGPSPQKGRPHHHHPRIKRKHHSQKQWPDGIVNQRGSQKQSGQQKKKTEDSQTTKSVFKEFAKSMKEKCSSYQEAKLFCEEQISNTQLPKTMHWRVFMELADMAKRENLTQEARYWFKQVNRLQPTAPQGWLEHAKLEEDSGNMKKCERLLRQGLDQCPLNEALIGKAVKYYESMNQINEARSILGRLTHANVEKCWKIVLEGALLESREGRIQIARDLFKFLMKRVGRHGPIFYEAYRLEEKCEDDTKALEIVEKGLAANPRYGPLWFSAFHLLEKIALRTRDYAPVRRKVSAAVDHISKELVWKVYFEAAKIEERAGNYAEAREMLSESVMKCLPNLRWKIWVAGARTELASNSILVARNCLNRALHEVPNKTRAVVLIECARLEEYTGNLEKARRFLSRAKNEAKHEWKVFLESILLEMRAGNIKQAIKEAEEALLIHRGTGRLWAVLIQLKQDEGEKAQREILHKALQEVPKSGEVWCEGARICLNPLSPLFNLQKARQYLNFAIKFTPQYGDSFIEYLRLELLSKGPRLEEQDKQYLEQLCVNADPNYGPLWFHCKRTPLDSTRHVLRRAKSLLISELRQYQKPYQRAILRFITKSSPSTEEQEEISKEGFDRKDFATGLQSIERNLMTDPRSKRKRIFGAGL